MLELVGAATKALASLVGPVASYAYKRSGKRFFESLLEEYTDPSVRTAGRVRRINQTLAQEGFTQHDVLDIANFCNSDEGEYCFRLIAINALAGNALRGEISSALAIQVGAMIRLYMRQPKLPYAQTAANVIVAEAASVVLESAASLKKRDRVLADELRIIAVEQSRLPDLLKASQLKTRASHIAALSDLVPATVESEVLNYCELLADDYGELTVASGAGASVAVPIGENLIQTTVNYRFGRKFASSLTGTDSILPTLLARHRYVILLGDPGGGKSTTVRAAVHEFAAAYLDGEAAPVPFVVTLRHFARELRADGDRGFVPYIVSNITAAHDEVIAVNTLRYLLHAGRAVVLFDGLDEILDVETRRQVVEKIERFSRRFAATAIVVTSREIGYDQAPVRRGFSHFVLQPFDDGQVERFAGNVFAAASRKDDLPNGELLSDFMTESEAVRDLRSNPLLLGVLCLLYSSSHRIPKNRLQLYRRCATMLFDVWDDERGIFVPLIDADAAEQAVREVALLIFRTGEEEISELEIKTALVDFYQSTSEALPRFRAQAFADDAFRAWTGRKWILSYAGEDDGESFYRFSHRTFLEYFSAEQVVYESETATDAWERIRDYAESGSATPFCELVIQMMAAKTRGSADKIIAAALDGLDIGAGDRSSLAVLQLFSSVIGGLRITGESREKVLWADLQLIRRLAPWDSVENLQRTTEPPYLGYRSIFEDSVDDVTDDYEDDVTIDDASSILKGFMTLEPEERCRLLERSASRLDAVLRDCDQTWLRLAYVLRQIPFFEGWQSVDRGWREELAGFAGRLWAAAVGSARVNLRPPRDVDYWLVGCLVREEAIADIEAITALGWRGLLIGGWPYPALGLPRAGTPAHTLALAAAGVARSGSLGNWSDDEVAALCSALLQILDAEDAVLQEILYWDRGDDHLANQTFQRLEGATDIEPRPGALEFSAERVHVAASLLGVISELGDQDFVQLVAEKVDRQVYGALRAAGLEVHNHDYAFEDWADSREPDFLAEEDDDVL